MLDLEYDVIVIGAGPGGHGLGTSNAVFSGTEVAKEVRRYHNMRFGFYPRSGS
jgi:pyruvate/2-oxoglutarate dehydrogenase complex dihydrolipoamide dehydrogenase (E3) component